MPRSCASGGFPKADCWIFSANVPGKKKTVMFYMCRLGDYRAALAEVRSGDHEGFVSTSKPALVA